MKRVWIPLFLAFLAPFFFPGAAYSVQPSKAPQTIISGHGWSYTIPFAVHNVSDIEKLIQCESQGVNVSRVDSDGIYSDGILQFHRGPLDTLQSSTWEAFSKASGITGSPLIPADAIQMADWAIDHGLGPHWTCWHIEHLSA
ncbi:MAG: hypothetical protein WBW84_15735 [Acidobacteriaceae bacterium]